MAFYVSIGLPQSAAPVVVSNRSAEVSSAMVAASAAAASVPGIGFPVAVAGVTISGLIAGVSTLFIKEQSISAGAVLRAAIASAMGQPQGPGYGIYSGAPGVPFSKKYLSNDSALQWVLIPAGALTNTLLSTAPPDFTKSIGNIINALDSLVVTTAPGLGGTFPLMGYAGGAVDFPSPIPPLVDPGNGSGGGGGSTGTGGGSTGTGGGALAPGGGIASLVTLLSLLAFLDR